MTKEELKKEADKWLRKYLLCYNCEKKCNCIESNSYCEQQVLKAYVDSAEPREKQIVDLEKENAELTEELTKKADTNHSLVEQMADLESENAELKETVIKMNNVITETFSNLTKAKKIIKDLCGMVRELNKPNVQLTNVDYSLSEAEQFLRWLLVL